MCCSLHLWDINVGLAGLEAGEVKEKRWKWDEQVGVCSLHPALGCLHCVPAVKASARSATKLITDKLSSDS